MLIMNVLSLTISFTIEGYGDIHPHVDRMKIELELICYVDRISCKTHSVNK